MKNRNVVVVIAVVAIVLGIIFIKHSFMQGKTAKKGISAAKIDKSKSAAAIPAKKVFSKGMGGLTVKVKGSNDKYQNLRVRAFSEDNRNSSVFAAAFDSTLVNAATLFCVRTKFALGVRPVMPLSPCAAELRFRAIEVVPT